MTQDSKPRELPKLFYKYDECVEVFWTNPFDGSKERLFMMMWPGHPIEETEQVEKWFQEYAERFCNNRAVEALEKRVAALRASLEAVRNCKNDGTCIYCNREVVKALKADDAMKEGAE